MNASRTVDGFMPDWAAITAVVLGVTAFAAAQGLTYPLASLVLESRAVPESLIGLNAASFGLGIVAATLLIRELTARVAGDRLIVLGLIGCSLCLAALAGFESLWIWFAARFLLGFCAGVIFIMSEAWLNTACPDRLRGRVSGVYGAGMCAGFALGPLAIPLFGTEDGFAFALLAVYVAAVAFLAAILSRRTRTRPAPSPAGAILRFLRGAPLLAGMVLAFGFADIAAISVMPVYFVKTGHSEAFAALSVTAMALPTALAQPLVGLLLDKLSRPVVVVGCGLIAAFSFLSIPLLQSEPAILAVFALMGAASFALYTCALTLLGEQYRGGLLVAGSAVLSMAYAVGSTLGASATGVAMDVLGPAAAPVGAGLALLAFAVLFACGRR